ncbi:MAG: ATP-binding cassette domain-containing protein [Clostridia bacterium]|nr:ATP-binding cassette domain-containing protein [Clostridia bacterium]
MIELKNISFSYGDLQILNNFSLTINNGEVVQLFGESGSGKTTVARIILGLENIDSGNIVVPQKISVVFQEDRLLENFDIQKNVRLVLKKEQYTFADSLLKEFGLYNIRKKKVSELSGGMKRRVALIRAIAYGGDALVLDEPFNGLDLENKRVASAIIKREYTDKNKPVLLISHIEEDGKLLNSNKISI